MFGAGKVATGSRRENQVPDLPLHPLDKCGEISRVPRSQIKLCDYNPRVIDADEKRRLKRSLELNGLSEPFVWNSRNGNLVGGHQRLSILDKSAPEGDWGVPAIIRDLCDTEERQLNVALNNQKSMGRYDDFKLGELLKTPNIDITACGFDLGMIKTILPQIAPQIPVVAAALEANSQKWKQEKIDQRTKEDAAVDRIWNGQAVGDKAESKILEEDSQFWLCFVFESFAPKMKLLEKMGIDSAEQFIKGEVLEELVSKVKECPQAVPQN